MKIPRALTIIILASSSISSISADQYNFENIKLNEISNEQNTYQPKDKLDESIIKGIMYSTKFVPFLNDGSDGEEYKDTITKDGKKFLVDKGYGWLNNSFNSEIQSVPFFAQTSINISGGAESDVSFSLNSLMKLLEFSRDKEEDLKTLLFSQVRYASAIEAEGSTTNLGLGIRHRPNDVSMLGANAFWDYRMTNYSNAHSRLGLGAEYLWKDFEFRNNWYMSITDTKNVTVGGVTYGERVIPGWDVEVGYRLPSIPELAFFVRGFNWDYSDRTDNSGVEGSVSWQANPYISLEAYVSNEISAASTEANSTLPGTDEVLFGLRLNITGEAVKYEKSNHKNNMITKMTQPVKRKYNVLLERSSGNLAVKFIGI